MARVDKESKTTDRPSDGDRWQQGQVVEVTITDLSDGGDGVGRFGSRVVFVPDTVTGDRALVRLIRVRPQYAHAQVDELLEASPHRIRSRCLVADKCGGCQWQHVRYAYQLQAKHNLVTQALQRIGGFDQPTVDPVLGGATDLGYRNKATYPLRSRTGEMPDGTGRSPMHAGYFRKGSHQIVNLNQCPIQDERLNPLLAEVKQDLGDRGWRVYDETRHRGSLRHLGLRIGRHTGEMLLTLVVKDWHLPGIEAQAQSWLQRYPGLVGVCLNRNSQRGNTIFGSETRCIAGQPFLQERFAGLTFHLRPDTFFQVNTDQAEVLLQVILDALELQGTESLVDAYCGIGTLTLPLAQKVRQAIGLEIQPQAVEQAHLNATLNQIENVSFEVGAVEQTLPSLGIEPDIVLLDPPRKGCDPLVLETLRQLRPAQIVYVSCNPATLARDLKLLCQGDAYHLLRVQPVDFFPQTAHVEAIAFLAR